LGASPTLYIQLRKIAGGAATITYENDAVIDKSFKWPILLVDGNI